MENVPVDAPGGNGPDQVPPFFDRHAAGTQLARMLHPAPGAIILGIARGGVVVAAAAARALGLPLDVLVIRKVGHPLQPELALGAVSAYGQAVRTEHAAAFPTAVLRPLFGRARRQAHALEEQLRAGQPPLDVSTKPVIVIDDGIATSATMLCALSTARERGVASAACAVPVAPVESIQLLRGRFDEVSVLVAAREIPFAVGRYYYSFGEVSDGRVREELAQIRG